MSWGSGHTCIPTGLFSFVNLGFENTPSGRTPKSFSGSGRVHFSDKSLLAVTAVVKSRTRWGPEWVTIVGFKRESENTD